MAVHDQIRKAFHDLIAPEFHALRGHVRLLDRKMDGVDATLTVKIDSLDRKIDDPGPHLATKIDSLRAETVSLRGELLAEIRRLDTRIADVDRELRTAVNIRERVAALEARRVS